MSRQNVLDLDPVKKGRGRKFSLFTILYHYLSKNQISLIMELSGIASYRTRTRLKLSRRLFCKTASAQLRASSASSNCCRCLHIGSARFPNAGGRLVDANELDGNLPIYVSSTVTPTLWTTRLTILDHDASASSRFSLPIACRTPCYSAARWRCPQKPV